MNKITTSALSVISLLGCVLLSGCCKGQLFANCPEHPTGKAKCEIAKCPGEEYITRDCSLATDGRLEENGKYYYRSSKTVANPLQCTFIRADDLPVKCTLKICSDVNPGPNWFEMAPYYDKDSCDRPTDPNKKNVKTVVRCYNANIVPAEPLLADGSVSLPNASTGVSYTQALKATDDAPGDCPVTFFRYRVTAGNLPVGIQLDNDTIKGAPVTAGTYKFTVTAVADNTGCPFSRKYTLKVN